MTRRELAVTRPEGATHYRWSFGGNRVAGWAPIPEDETIYAPPAARSIEFCRWPPPAPPPPPPPEPAIEVAPAGWFARLRRWLRLGST